jgi:LAGLIDADG DNA endonuclease family
LRTSYDVSLGTQRLRWYPRGIKRVPQDIHLSAISIAHWYFGDGTVGCKGYHAKFCTDGFTRHDVKALIRALRDHFGWQPLVEERNRILLCKMADRVSLVEMLRTQQIPTCFRYKLRLRLRYKAMVVVGAVEDRLRTLRQNGCSYSQISVELKLSKSGAWSACRRLGIH